MFEQIYNQAIPRLEKAFKLIKEGEVVMMEYGRAIVNGHKVNYTLEKCDCEDFEHRKCKCKHIWAAQLRQQQLTQEVIRK